jgi:putative transposase
VAVFGFGEPLLHISKEGDPYLRTLLVQGAQLPNPGGEPAMKGTRHSEEQIIAILKQGEAGLTTAELCRQHGITEQTYYRWKAKYGGMESGDAKKMKQLEDENRKLKHVVAELTLDNRALKDVLSKNW